MNHTWKLTKKTGGFIALLTLLLLLGAASRTEAAGAGILELPLGYNDDLTVIKAELNEGALYVPLRETAQILHLEVGGSSKSIVLTGSKHSVTIVPDERKAIAGDRATTVKTYASAGRTMIPVSLLKSTFNFGAAYDASVPVARITSGKQKLSLEKFIAANLESLKPAAPAEANPKPEQPKTPDKPQTPESKKPIYLTFDDGPTAHTAQLLDILDKYDARGTFFMLGPNIASYPSAVKRLVDSGSSAGLHGMTHVKNKFYASPASALKEMQDDNQALYKAAGVKTKLIRTPYGSKPYFTKAYRDKVLSAGFHLWDWNVDSEDWKYKTDHKRVIRSILEQIDTVERQGTVPVVLMHDQAATLKVLPEVLKTLRDEGFTFEVITDDTAPVNFWKDKR
ncbi:polysaccharide deacetylase family protein [Saccharibacillus sp. CPCC 101409]|uniref:polysaccharide deacetylase n=1 Tax=Saccharibacillus sp. CPCC 101409 TaxID=3058041 RepID=UPI0026738D57|nr:polysaccharide deacetylase [Saccharibacillus sp. CPCC 101409]MDO3408311.1 polysaccharide deacetylase family protein [Saccharibacillus sp. CPCC 101409]